MTVRGDGPSGGEVVSSRPRPLVPLRIPTGWVVGFNRFVDLDPDDLDPDEADAHLSQDLLWIEQVGFGEPGWRRFEGRWTMDVGWYPDADVTGTYRLVVLPGTWDDPTATFEGRDWRAVAAAMDLAFAAIGRGDTLARIRAILAGFGARPAVTRTRRRR